MTPRALTVAAVAAVALALGLVVQDSGPNQAAHYALVRSLANGTAEIDPRETIDASYVDGRFYAAKAPGLALFTLPWYGVLRGLGLQDDPRRSIDDYRNGLWALTLFGAVLPAVVLVLLLIVAVERVAPGDGTPTATLLLAGSLLLPFATLFFDHLLAATLGFAAFVVLLRERDGPSSRLLVAGGLLAGLGIVVEFPLGLVAVALAGYATIGRGRPVARLASYAAGVAAGIAPLLVYNQWAFGSPWTLAYTNALEAPVGSGPPVVGANDEGLYGVGLPDPRAALSLLVSEKGLLVVTPLAILAVVGLPLLWRSGRRAEALVCGAVPVLFLAYNAAYYLPFGGQGPGPRFLVAAMPFLALPLAFVLRARPVVTVGLGLVSAAVMTLATLAGPLTGVEYGIGTWLSALGDGDVVTTIPARLGVEPEWLAAAIVVLVLVAALALALAGRPVPSVTRADAAVLGAAVAAWLLVVLVGSDLVPASEEHGTRAGALAAAFLLVALGLAVRAAARSGVLAFAVLVPSFVLALPALESRPRASLLVTLALLAGAIVVTGRTGRPRRL